MTSVPALLILLIRIWLGRFFREQEQLRKREEGSDESGDSDGDDEGVAEGNDE
jgi:hypothetical protein